jgi:hypothetical protein
MTSGMVKTQKDWIIRSQVLRALVGSMDAVQRLDGGRFRFTNNCLSSELKIESGPPEMEP